MTTTMRLILGLDYPTAGRSPSTASRTRSLPADARGTCAAAGPAGRQVAIADRELTASMVAVTRAIEITVHGRDIFLACGPAGPCQCPATIGGGA